MKTCLFWIPAVLAWTAPAVADPWNGQQTFGLTAQLGGGEIRVKDAEDDRFAMGLASASGRFRLNRRWEFSAGLVRRQGEQDDVRRRHELFEVGARLHFNPDNSWVVSALAGIGLGRENVHDRRGAMTEKAGVPIGEGLLGVSLERRFDDFGIGADLVLFSVQRDRDRLSEQDRMGPTLFPEKSGGGELRLAASYYF
jgi:hypothetical protein